MLKNHDINIVPDRLDFVRVYPSRYTLRTSESKKSAFCLGWQDNLHMSVEIDSTLGITTLTVSGSERHLYQLNENENIYESSEYDLSTDQLDSTGLVIITSKLYKIVYFYHMQDQCLRRIELDMDSNDVLVLKVNCRKGKISDIATETNSVLIRFFYSQSNCLTGINKFMRDEGGRTELITYAYDSQKRLVFSTGSGFKQSMSYGSNNNLIKLNEEKKFTYSFEYDNENHIGLKKMSLYDELMGQYMANYEFEIRDDGFTTIYDSVRGARTEMFYDLNGRLVYMNQNDLAIKQTSNMDSENSEILQNGEVSFFNSILTLLFFFLYSTIQYVF